MSSGGVNPEIVKCLEQSTEDDPILQKFLIGLLSEEAKQESKAHWRWKKNYKKKIEEALVRWERKDED